MIGIISELLSCWDNSFFSIKKMVIDKRFILIMSFVKSLNLRCGIGNTYGPNVNLERRQLRKDLRRLFREKNIPACIEGDNNVVKIGDERIGVTTNEKAMETIC